MTSIDLIRDKANRKNEFCTKTRELIDSVRDETASDVPDEFLELAISTLVKDLKAEVAAANKAVQVKEEQRERSSRLTSAPTYTPVPTSTPAPASRSEDLATPLVSGRTAITLRRANSNGHIRVRKAFWGNLAAFPPALPPPEQLPELSA